MNPDHVARLGFALIGFGVGFVVGVIVVGMVMLAPNSLWDLRRHNNSPRSGKGN